MGTIAAIGQQGTTHGPQSQASAKPTGIGVFVPHLVT